MQINPFQAAMFGAQVLYEMANVDRNHDGKTTPDEYATAALNVTKAAAQAFPGAVNINKDPERLQAAANGLQQFLDALTGKPLSLPPAP